MFFRELTFPGDYRLPEAASMVFQEVYGDHSERSDIDRVTSFCMANCVNYCGEDSCRLLAVGTIDSRHIDSGLVVLNNIAVEPTQRGNGIGRRLMEFLEEESKAAGADLIRLVSLESALDFYLKLGYQPVNSDQPLELAKLI